jgi:hypothetical protein
MTTMQQQCGVRPEHNCGTGLFHSISIVTLLLLFAAVCNAGDTQAPTTAEPVPGFAMEYLPEDGSCDLQEADGLPEEIRETLFEISCYSLRWFDSLFGDEHDFPERDIAGLMRVGFKWNQYDDFDPKLRFRLRMSLPNVSSRYQAFVGRVDEQAFVKDSRAVNESGFDSSVREDEAEWLLGLGYSQHREQQTGWDWSAGVRMRFPPRPYVRARWRTGYAFSDKFDMNFRQVFFWRDGDPGFGTTSRLDTAREVSDRDVIRLELIGTLSEETNGLDWWAGHSWYHGLGDQRGLSLLAFARGETSDPVSLHEYGFHLTYRRPLGREWLFLNVGPTVTWPREQLDEQRDLSLGVTVLFELMFGKRYR